jgi:hypothetical protein
MTYGDIRSSGDEAWDSGRLKLGKAVAVTAIAFVLMAVTIMTLPQGRAWAQQIFKFFTRTEALFFPLSPKQIEGANQAQYDHEMGVTQTTAAPPESLMFFVDSCDDVEPSENLHCQVGLAEGAVGFTILLPPLDEWGLTFSSLTVDSVTKSVKTSYGYEGYPGREHAVWISQGIGSFPAGSDWDKVPSQFIEPIVVNGERAEYVQGAFVAKPGAEEATWMEDGPMARLRWRDGERWFEIFKAGTPERVTFMDREGMIHLAESLRDLDSGG